MGMQAISVTLAADNLVWLRGRARAGARSVSETLDRLVAAARRSGTAGESRSVGGTVTITPSDPDLSGADELVRALFGASLARERSRAGSWGRRRVARRTRG